MNNDKNSSLKWFIDQLEEKGICWENTSIRRVQISIDVNNYLELQKQAKVMQQEQAQQYAEFCIECDRQSLPLIDFNNWIALNETFNNET